MTEHRGVAIIGCGLIGRKRAAALGAARLVACADLVAEQAERLAESAAGCRAFTDWKEAIGHPGVEIVVVATLHDSLAEITRAAITAGRHVLVEKPAARNAGELLGLDALARSYGVRVRVGFNHRRHRAFRDARLLIDSGALGPLMFVRGRYGHGGRIGYDKEWRADPRLSGGGELIDQGCHIIDLARWILGDFTTVEGFAATYFWQMPVDDNAFLLLRTADGKTAFLHASCTEWKNMFSFEIYGRDGKIDITGLGGSYGVERMAFYKMLPEMGPPETHIREYPMADDSWSVEFSDFLQDIRLARQPDAGLADAASVLEIVGAIYRSPDMISTRSPLRISLGGGGTDLPSYYRAHGGFLIAGAIDRFVYLNVLRPFTPGVFLKYSKLEHVATVDEVQHPIIREALRMVGFRTPQVEITALADIPSGTGLGSSGSFTTALLKALYAHRMRAIDPKDLAELACRIEIDILGEPIGKQDQYIAACGGITCFTFNPDGSVEVEPLGISIDTKFDLEDNLLLFFTGFSRGAGSILKDQNERTKSQDEAMLANLHYVKELGIRSRELLVAGETSEFGALMHEHWEHKKRRSGGMSMPEIDEWYDLGRRNGAIGGKLVGAGGGGFLLFYAEDRNRLRHAMAHAGLEEVRFRFEFEGTKVMYS